MSHSAAQMLGGAAGDLLAKEIGVRIGVRIGVHAGVSDNSSPGGLALTTGKHSSLP